MERKGGGDGRDSEEGIPQDLAVLGYPEGLSWLCVVDNCLYTRRGASVLSLDSQDASTPRGYTHPHPWPGLVAAAPHLSCLLLPPQGFCSHSCWP